MAIAKNFTDTLKDFETPEEVVEQTSSTGSAEEASIDSEEIDDDELEDAEDIVNDDTASSEADDDSDEEFEEAGSDVADEEDEEFSWDLDDDSDEPEKPEPSFDFSKLAKELGDESIKDEVSLKTHLSTLKTKLAETEAKAKTAEKLDSLPEHLRDAVNLALEGGDYLDYLGVNSIDYSRIPPADLFVDDVINSFTNSNGEVDMERANDYLDSLTDAEKEYRGVQLQRQLINLQKQEKAKIQNEAKFRAAKRSKEIQEAVQSLNEVSGLKLSPKHKQELISDMTKGSIEKALLGENYKQKDVAELMFKAKYFDKIKKVLEQNTKSSTKKQLVNSLTNSSVKQKGKQATGKQPQQLTGADLYLKQLLNK